MKLKNFTFKASSSISIVSRVTGHNHNILITFKVVGDSTGTGLETTWIKKLTFPTEAERNMEW